MARLLAGAEFLSVDAGVHRRHRYLRMEASAVVLPRRALEGESDLHLRHAADTVVRAEPEAAAVEQVALARCRGRLELERARRPTYRGDRVFLVRGGGAVPERHVARTEADGPGSVVGVGNANPIGVESYQRPVHKAWQGRCLVIIKSTDRPGEIRLRVSSAGLPAGETTIRSVT